MVILFFSALEYHLEYPACAPKLFLFIASLDVLRDDTFNWNFWIQVVFDFFSVFRNVECIQIRSTVG